MRRLFRVLLAVAMVTAVLVPSAGVADAQGECDPDGGFISCDVDTESGTVGVEGPGSDGVEGSSVGSDAPDVCDAIPGYGNCAGGGDDGGSGSRGGDVGVVNGSSWCELFPDDERCQPAPEFCDTDAAAGGVCGDTGQPCIDQVIPGAPSCDATVGPPPRPVFTPPTVGEAAQRALDQVVWPSISAGASDFGEGKVYGGFEYSLSLAGYESWEPLVASATITQTIVVEGWVFTEDFTATLTATPREVFWDTGPINSTPVRHSPPTTVVCDGPGVVDWYLDGRFQNFVTYDRYGGDECLFVFWNNSAAMGGDPVELSAEVFWDLTLDTSWAGDVGSVGDHTEVYGSGSYIAEILYAVNVIEGAESSSTTNGG